MAIDTKILKRAEEWLKEPFDEKTRREVRRMIDSDPKALSDAFFKDLSFGTGGMRGLMGPGTARMNEYTISAATLGLGRVLLKQPKLHSVFIGYDVRNHSKEFALVAARVLAAQEIRVYLTRDICPTPLVSFGCRHFQCSAAIMITASHNPPAYNGYKVYWNDGGQVVASAQEIIDEVRKIPISKPFSLAPVDSPLIQWIGKELDDAYLKALKKLQLYPDLAHSPLKLLYTPLHGTGIRMVPEALKSWGFTHLHLVEAQKNPDGNFTHAPSPNPEDKKALELGIDILVKNKEDLLIATDPDADRIGVVALNQGKAFSFTGNQMACLLLFHICSALRLKKIYPPKAAFIKTIVTTELFRTIVQHFGGTCFDVLTGFKYIAEKMTEWEKGQDAHQFVFGAEESYGCLFGTLVRDKDAVNASCLIAEAAALAKKENLTLVDRLYQIYLQFGVHRESLLNLSFEDSEAGMNQMNALMKNIRKSPPASIGGVAVVHAEDYLSSTSTNLKTKHSTTLTLPKSDVLRFWLQDGSKIVIRPSGTEPKVKIYGEVVQTKVKDVSQAIVECDHRVHSLMDSFEKLVNTF